MEFNTNPIPVHNEHPESWQLVIDDMKEDKLMPAGVLPNAYQSTMGTLLALLAVKYNLNPEDDVEFEEVLSRFYKIAESRNEFGASKYGTALQPFNGRSSLDDSIEEALDLAVYLRTAIYETYKE